MADQYTQIMVDHMPREEFDGRRRAHEIFAGALVTGVAPVLRGAMERIDTFDDTILASSIGMILPPHALMGDTRWPWLYNMHRNVERTTEQVEEGVPQANILQWELYEQMVDFHAEDDDFPHDEYEAFHKRQYDTLTELGRNRVIRERAERIVPIANLGTRGEGLRVSRAAKISGLNQNTMVARGDGVSDDLKRAATSVAKKSGAHALTQLGNVHDVASAKDAARSVGKEALKEGKSQLHSLASKYFSGAGTPAKAAKVCEHNVTTLRKIVTAFRRDLRSGDGRPRKKYSKETGRAMNTGTRQCSTLRDYHKMLKSKDGGVKTIPAMTRDELVSYIYSTARKFDVDWSPYFDKYAKSSDKKVRLSESCRKPADSEKLELEVDRQLSGSQKPKKTKKTRRANTSSYNNFVKHQMKTHSFPAGTSQTGKMKIVAVQWADAKKTGGDGMKLAGDGMKLDLAKAAIPMLIGTKKSKEKARSKAKSDFMKGLTGRG